MAHRAHVWAEIVPIVAAEIVVDRVVTVVEEDVEEISVAGTVAVETTVTAKRDVATEAQQAPQYA